MGAHLGGQLVCGNATLNNPSGPALDADGLETGHDVFLTDVFSATGAGTKGAVRLLGARIGGKFHGSNTIIINRSGPALGADNLQTGGGFFLAEGFSADGAGPGGAVRLAGARIGAQLDSAAGRVSSPDPHGFDRSTWLDLLYTATPSYAAQPYQQLASVYRAAGHDSDVRAILIRQRRAQLARGVRRWSADWWWGRVTGVLLGYGYRPWQALLWLLGVLLVSVGLALLLGGHGALALTPAPSPTISTAAREPAAVPCTLVGILGKGLDLGTPFLTASPIGVGKCDVTSNATGAALTISRWVLQLAAWALAALFVAGFTGIVRKT